MFPRIARITTILALLTLVFAVFGGDFSPPARAADPGGPTLAIPLSQTTPKIDGLCTDYDAAVKETFADGGGSTGTVSVQHDGNYIYVCMQGAAGSNKERFGSLYLDPQGDGSSYQFAAKDDYALRVGIPGTSMTSYNGSNVANGYTVNNVIPGFWDGAAATTPNFDAVEYRVSIGRFKLGDCGKLFGIAAYHQWFATTGDDYGWPSNQYFDQPRTWRLATLANGPCSSTEPRGKIAYVFRGRAESTTSFYNLLTGAGYSVTLVPLGDVVTTNFTSFDLTIVADDTGSLNQWGTTSLTDLQVAQIKAGGKPIIGLGEGGYAFFGKWPQFIGWPNGWHGPDQDVAKAAAAPAAYYTGVAADPVKLYGEPVNTVSIYLNSPPVDVLVIGEETPATQHAPLIQQNCRLLWGFSGSPNAMTDDGKTVFLNAVGYMSRFQCASEPAPSPNCIIKKSADPPAGTPVAPGQTIVYTITYTNCREERGKLVDSVPTDTLYVPGSATGGATLTADGALVWDVGAGTSGSVSFKVLVDKRLCSDASKVFNRAQLLIPGTAPLLSEGLVHPAKCPPIVLPNDQPTYAEDEIQITPYPLILGKPSQISVRLHNASATSQHVLVEFQASPDKFGIGIPFNTFDSRGATLPANGTAIVHGTFTPAASGHFCIQIKITIPGNPPTILYTQRNLDVTENLLPGQPDTLTFKVGNPTAAPADIKLVVDNTCPGWTATVAPALLTGVGPNGSDIRNATLTVTPPNPVTLGSGCHIDVQGWIGDNLIGGIRKLDVPPVHLPRDVDPPWAEPEISFGSQPIVAGQPNQICVDLQNPLDVARAVTLDYAVADFGAGIAFTTVATRSLTLPPASTGRYCADWTPAGTGTLHRCVLITLRQANYAAMRSQRNVDLVRALPTRLGDFVLPLTIANPDLVAHTLGLSETLVGINPFWKVVVVTDKGDPPPTQIGAGETLQLQLKLVPAVQTRATISAAPDDYRYGDASQVEVAVRFDDQQIGGFSVALDTPKTYLPLMAR